VGFADPKQILAYVMVSISSAGFGLEDQAVSDVKDERFGSLASNQQTCRAVQICSGGTVERIPHRL
jgi:hypothetical protein